MLLNRSASGPGGECTMIMLLGDGNNSMVGVSLVIDIQSIMKFGATLNFQCIDLH